MNPILQKEGVVSAPVGESISPITADLENYFQNLGDGREKYDGLATGFSDIDEAIGGLQKFVLLGGIAGAGKSTLALQLALGVIQQKSIPVVYYSFEMAKEDIITLAMQNLSEKQLNNSDITLNANNPNLAEEKANALVESARKLGQLGKYLYVFDAAHTLPDVAKIKVQIENIKHESGEDRILVVIDSFQDLVTYKSSNKSQVQLEDEVIQSLEVLQQQTGATLLVISQKSRDSFRGSTYEGLRGSISLYHKPTTVLELITHSEILNSLEASGYKGAKLERRMIEDRLESSPLIARPAVLYVSKHRNNTNKRVNLRYYGSFRYFEGGKEKEFTNPNKYRFYSYFNI